MEKLLPVALLCLFLFSNCKKENLSKNDKTKALASEKEDEELVLTIKKEWEPSPGEIIRYVVTDTAGNLLSVKEVGGEDTLSLTGKAIKSNLINVYRVQSTIHMLRTSIHGTLAVKKGSIWNLGTDNSSSSAEIKSFKPILKNIPSDYTSINLGAGFGYVSQLSSQDTSTLNRTNIYYRAGSRLHVELTNSKGEKFYNLFTINPSNDYLEIDLSKCDKPYKKQSVAYPSFVHVSYLGVGTSNNNGPHYGFFGYQLESIETATNPIIVSFPENNYFKPTGLFYSAYRKEWTQGFNNYSGWYSNQIPKKIELLDAHIEEVKPVENGKKWIVDITGKADFYEGYFSIGSDWDKEILLTIASPVSFRNIMLPDLSAILENYKRESVMLNWISAVDVNCTATDLEWPFNLNPDFKPTITLKADYIPQKTNSSINNSAARKSSLELMKKRFKITRMNKTELYK